MAALLQVDFELAPVGFNSLFPFHLKLFTVKILYCPSLLFSKYVSNWLTYQSICHCCSFFTFNCVWYLLGESMNGNSIKINAYSVYFDIAVQELYHSFLQQCLGILVYFTALIRIFNS